ncbi:hypothetical protein [Kineococcus auxinigenes]|uniref:hypothetical protein n=1 Tax=unclassified Kineococcus TaxID=2621656 RepID=UPI003D7CEEF9
MRATLKAVRASEESTQASNIRHQADARAALKRHRVEDRKWREEQYGERYQAAASQLGHSSAAVRLAGVYAMSRLADEWSNQRQACIDVLCAYARTSFEHSQIDERQVRRAIAEEVFRRLQTSEPSWAGQRIDLSGAYIEDLQFPHRVLRNLRMDGAWFEGFNVLSRAQVVGAVSFRGAHFSGSFRLLTSANDDSFISFADCEIAGKRFHVGVSRVGPRDSRDKVLLNLNNLMVTSGAVFFSLRGHFTHRAVWGSRAAIRGRSKMMFNLSKGSAAENSIILRDLAVEAQADILCNDPLRGAAISLGDMNWVTPGKLTDLDFQGYDPDPMTDL